MLVNYHTYKISRNTNGNSSYGVSKIVYYDENGTIQIAFLPGTPIPFSSTEAIADAIQAFGCRIKPKVKYKNNELTIQLESFFIILNIGIVYIENGVTNYDDVNTDELSTAYKPKHSVVYGCTDSDAMNYSPTATENDGSCVYAPISAVDILRRKTNNFNASLIHKERLGEKVCCCQHSLSKYLVKVLKIADEAFNNDVLLQEEVRSRAIINLNPLPKGFFQNGMELELVIQMPDTTNLLSIASFPTNYYGKAYSEIATLISQQVNLNSNDYFCIANTPSSGMISIYSPSGEAEAFNGAVLKIQKNQAYGFVEKKNVFTSDHHFTDAIYVTEASTPFFYGGDSDNNSLFSFYFDNETIKQQTANDSFLLPETIVDLDTQESYAGSFRSIGARYTSGTKKISSANLTKNIYAGTAYSFDKIYGLESFGSNTRIVQFGQDQEEDSFLFNPGYDSYICCNQNDGNLFCFNAVQGKFAVVIHTNLGIWSVTYWPIVSPIGDPVHGRPVFNKDMNHVLFPYEGSIYCINASGGIDRQILMNTHDLYSLTIVNDIYGVNKGIVMNALHNYNTRIEKYSTNYLTFSVHNTPIKITGYTTVTSHALNGGATITFVDYDNDVCNFDFDNETFDKQNLNLPEPYTSLLLGFSGSDHPLNHGIEFHYLNVKISTPEGDYVRFYAYKRQKQRGIQGNDLKGLCNYVFKYDDANPLVTMTKFFDDHNGSIIIWDFWNDQLTRYVYGFGGGDETIFNVNSSIAKAYGLNFSETLNPLPCISLEAGYVPEGMQIDAAGASEAYLFLATDSNSPILMQFNIDNLSGLSSQRENDPIPFVTDNGSINITSITKIAGGDNKIYLLGTLSVGGNGFAVCGNSGEISITSTTNPIETLIYTHQQLLLLVVSGTQLFAYDVDGLNPQPILNNDHDFTGHEVNAYYDRGTDTVLLIDVTDNKLFLVNMNTLSMDGEILASSINDSILLKKPYHDFSGTVIYASFQDPSVQKNGFVKFDLVDGVIVDLNATFSQGQNAVYENDVDKCLPLSTVQTMVDNSLQLLRNCDI